MIGRIDLCERLVPELKHADFVPWQLKRAAEEDAYQEFLEEYAKSSK